VRRIRPGAARDALMGGPEAKRVRSLLHDAETLFGLGLLLAALLMAPSSSSAWDSRTHELITALAIDALPQSSLRDAFERNKSLLEEYSIEPDTVLKAKYGRSEKIRHYLDLEEFGDDPFSKLDPDVAAMRKKYGDQRLESSGILPWTVDGYAHAVSTTARNNDCAQLLRDAGYLSHYVGDASMPLHSTRYYDGYTLADRGVHARFEGATDDQVPTIERLTRADVHPSEIDSVWTPTIDQIKEANGYVAEVIEADRAVRAEGARGGFAYDRAIAGRELPLMQRQVASAASLLASIWIFEWRKAGSPPVCVNNHG
jgi:hypothetical protein